MADLNNTFQEFNNIIKLSSTKKEQLRVSRNAIREDIRKYFKENRDLHTVKFKGQGSFAMNTTILPNNLEYDVDDGVYIQGKEEHRPSPTTAHNWILKAVENRTNEKSIDKNTCVRVQYAAKYHIDLPIYYVTTDNIDESFLDTENLPKLAHKSKNWIVSDPYAFKLWFDDQVKNKPQLKRIVRYLKAWTDNKQDSNSKLNLPSGIVFTILACDNNNFVQHERDDISFLETLKNIQNSIDDSRVWSAVYSCNRPTPETSENLLDKYSADTTKNNFLNSLNNLIVSGEKAIKMKLKKDACAKWQKHLGDRFPCSSIEEDEKDLAKSFASSDSIRLDNKSA